MRPRWKYLLGGALLSIAAGQFSHGPSTPYPFTLPFHFPPIKSGVPIITQEEADLGRHLFYDSKLSINGSTACSTCHQQGTAFSDASRPLSRNAHGATTRRNTMPLFNLAWYEAFGWDGRSSTLEDQVQHAMLDEMGTTMADAIQRVKDDPIYQDLFSRAYAGRSPDGDLAADALAQFLRTLVSHRSKYDRVIAMEEAFTPDEFDGFVLVNDQSMANCLHCHVTDAHALGTTGAFSNNGLDASPQDPGLAAISHDPKDLGRFRIPSLRNVAVTGPYMHDGRFNTLEEVLDHYAEGAHGGPHTDPKLILANAEAPLLTREERRKIIAFLHTLTDHDLMTDPRFGDPWAGR